MRQKVYKFNRRNNVTTQQEYEDYVSALASRRSSVQHHQRSRTRRPHPPPPSPPPPPPQPPLRSGFSIIVLDDEKPLLKRLEMISRMVTGHVLYSVELWTYLGGRGVVSYARFRTLAIHLESVRVSCLLHATVPPMTQDAARYIEEAMVCICYKMPLLWIWIFIYNILLFIYTSDRSK